MNQGTLMNQHKGVLTLSLMTVLTLTLISTASAVPPLPASFWGSVSANGANLPAGTIIKAAIDGVNYAVAVVEIINGESIYALDVPGDDESTPGVIEGGASGDAIHFMLGTRPANQTGTWASGTNLELDLTFTTTAPPVLPASYYGTVKIDGENAPASTLIKAAINGVTYAVSPVILYLGEAVYSLNVPGDDPGTPGILEGGVGGDSVQFFIGEFQADQTGTWMSEANTEINLTGSAPKIEITYHFPVFYR